MSDGQQYGLYKHKGNLYAEEGQNNYKQVWANQLVETGLTNGNGQGIYKNNA